MIHKTAIVDPKAKISSNVKIGPYSIIGPNVEINENSEIKFSDFQKSERDFAFILDKKFQVQELIDVVSGVDKELIKSVKVFDVYEGKNIPDDKKSIALNVTIQSSEKTLNEYDLNKINETIISAVESKTDAKIRS